MHSLKRARFVWRRCGETVAPAFGIVWPRAKAAPRGLWVALVMRQLAERRGYRALLIVTDNYHTGRARLTFRKALRRCEARLAFVAATPDWVHWDR